MVKLNAKSDEPKKGHKKLIFRIFCESLAKTSLGSLVNSGFPAGTVEIVFARGRALTPIVGQADDYRVERRSGGCPG